MPKKSIYRLLIRSIGILLLVYLLSKIHFQTLLAGLHNVSLCYLFMAFLLLIPFYLIKAYRWKYMLSLQQIEYPYKNAVLAFCASNFIAFITPGKLGEIAKAFYISRDKEIRFSASLPAVIFDRLFDMYVLILFVITGAVMYSSESKGSPGLWVLFAALIFLPMLLLSRTAMMPIVNRFFDLPGVRTRKTRAVNAFDNFYVEVSSVLNYRLSASFLLTLLAYVEVFYCSLMISKSCGFDFSYGRMVFYVSIVSILSYLPITVAGLGTREAALIVLFAQIGRSKEEAILFSTIYFFVFFILGGLIGYLCFTLKPIDIKSVRAMKESKVG